MRAENKKHWFLVWPLPKRYIHMTCVNETISEYFNIFKKKIRKKGRNSRIQQTKWIAENSMINDNVFFKIFFSLTCFTKCFASVSRNSQFVTESCAIS